MILLIVAALPEARLKGALSEFATHLGLEVLVETHNLTELEIAHRIGAQIIGVNNRNQDLFETGLHTSLELATSFRTRTGLHLESLLFSHSSRRARMLALIFNGILRWGQPS